MLIAFPNKIILMISIKFIFKGNNTIRVLSSTGHFHRKHGTEKLHQNAITEKEAVNLIMPYFVKHKTRRVSVGL